MPIRSRSGFQRPLVVIVIVAIVAIYVAINVVVNWQPGLIVSCLLVAAGLGLIFTIRRRQVR